MVATKKPQPPTKQSDDVEMVAASPAADATAEEVKPVPIDPDVTFLDDLKEHAKLVEKYVALKEPRFMLRVLRSLVSTRKRLNAKVLRKLLVGYYTHAAACREELLAFVEEPMDTETGTVLVFKPRVGKGATQPLLPELDAYFHLLVVLYSLDQNRTENVTFPVDLERISNFTFAFLFRTGS